MANGGRRDAKAQRGGHVTVYLLWASPEESPSTKATECANKRVPSPLRSSVVALSSRLMVEDA